MTDPESGISPVESTAPLVHYSSSEHQLLMKTPLTKIIEVGTLTESIPQGAVSSSSQKAQPQGTVLPGTFLHYNITRF